jgi:hypothetical protein
MNAAAPAAVQGHFSIYVFARRGPDEAPERPPEGVGVLVNSTAENNYFRTFNEKFCLI